MDGIFDTEEFENITVAIYDIWNHIGADVERRVRTDNMAAMYACLANDQLATLANEPELQEMLNDKIARFGIQHVVDELTRRIGLVG